VETILTELDNLGMLENTIIIFTADHGELCGAHGMWGKGATAYREQNNVPFILYHPDMPGGKKCRAVTAHNDIVPTILAMTGSDKKQKNRFRQKTEKEGDRQTARPRHVASAGKPPKSPLGCHP
jgi:arylsulfatase